MELTGINKKLKNNYLFCFSVSLLNDRRYMGIGLSKSEVQLNRLPGWDKNSYGYHGDDGHSFCCSGTGQTYGPTFTTGDVIGCCWNLIENICFYTKNGFNLGNLEFFCFFSVYVGIFATNNFLFTGVAFRDLPVSFGHRFVCKWSLFGLSNCLA
jgi:hypothetical protein